MLQLGKERILYLNLKLEEMKVLKMIGSLFMMACLATACTNEDSVPSVNPIPGEEPKIDLSTLDFKDLEMGSLENSVAEGVISGEGSNVSTRNRSDVDSWGRPLGRYPLKELYLMSVKYDPITKQKTVIKTLKVSTENSLRLQYAEKTIDGVDYVVIRPVQNTEEYLLVQLSELQPSASGDYYIMPDAGRGDSFYFCSNDATPSVLPTYDGNNTEFKNGNFYKEIGDVLFCSPEYIFAKLDRKMTITALEAENEYHQAYPSQNGLWPIRLNRYAAGISLRLMVTGDYYEKNKDNQNAINAAWEDKIGFPTQLLSSYQAYIENYPIAYDISSGVILPGTWQNQTMMGIYEMGRNNLGNLVLYDETEPTGAVKELEFRYESTSQKGMGLESPATPFAYPMGFTPNIQKVHISLAIDRVMRMEFIFSLGRNAHNVTMNANTNTFLYLLLTDAEMRALVDEAVDKVFGDGDLNTVGDGQAAFQEAVQQASNGTATRGISQMKSVTLYVDKDVQIVSAPYQSK